jgi:hypothetical protein
VIILYKDIVQRHNSLNVTVLGLDSHHHVVHSGQDEYQFSAIAQTYVELYVGEIVDSEKKDVLDRFKELFDKATSRFGDERSAAAGRQGHQKTPVFIHALLLQALNSSCHKTCNGADVLPRGGFTDVGQHTGGEARDTAFALVRSLCIWTMSHSFNQNPKVLYSELSCDAMMLHFDSFILKAAIQVVEEIVVNESSNLPLESISHLWKVMKVICATAARLSDEGHDLSAHFSKMKLYKLAILKVQSQWHQTCAMKYTIELPHVPYRVPAVLVPPISTFPNFSQATLANIKLLINENIDSIPTFSLDEYWTVSSAHKWAGQVQSTSVSSSSSLSVYLRLIEKVFWNLSEKYLVESLELQDLKKVADLLDFYRQSATSFFSLNSKATYASSFRVRMRSIELLATWLIYCIAFNATRATYPDILADYGVALHFQDLRHLVLQDEEHILVLKKVVTFLRNNHCGEDKEIFSMRRLQNWNSATFQMGHLYAKLYLSETLLQEKEDAKLRVTKHWQEVDRKQRLVRRLRNELTGLAINYEEAEAKRMSMSSPTQSVRDARRAAKSAVKKKEREIVNAERAPLPVIQPLPRSDHNALKVLFFLYMSEEFKILSQLSLVAQQLLVPRPWEAQCGGQDGIQKVDVFVQIQVEQKEISWTQHYNTYQKCCYHTPLEIRQGCSQWLDISMHVEVPASTDIGPRYINDFVSSGDGIYFPDINDMRLVWHGGSLARDRHESRGQFNPFKIPYSYTGK